MSSKPNSASQQTTVVKVEARSERDTFALKRLTGGI